MSLTKHLVAQCEEFLQQITIAPDGTELDEQADALRAYMGRNLDGWTKAGKECLAYGILKRLEVLWVIAAERDKDCQCPSCRFHAVTGALKAICHDRLLQDQPSESEERDFGGCEYSEDENHEEDPWYDDWEGDEASPGDDYLDEEE